MNNKIGARIRHDRRGVAAAEFALIGSILVVLMLGMVDIATIVRQQFIMYEALRAAGQYAMWYPTQTRLIAEVLTGVAGPQGTQAIPGALPTTGNWANASVGVCTCGLGSENACSDGACPSNGEYVVMSASVPISFLFLTLSQTNTVSYAVRVQ